MNVLGSLFIALLLALVMVICPVVTVRFLMGLKYG